METSIAKPVKDFADIMATVDFKNLDKKVKSIEEMSLSELQSNIDFQNEEIRFNFGIVSKSTCEKEISFHQQKIREAQQKLHMYSIQHITVWVNS